jgi:hypothetical protein
VEIAAADMLLAGIRGPSVVDLLLAEEVNQRGTQLAVFQVNMRGVLRWEASVLLLRRESSGGGCEERPKSLAADLFCLVLRRPGVVLSLEFLIFQDVRKSIWAGHPSPGGRRALLQGRGL